LIDEIRDAIDAMEAVVAKDDDPAVKAVAGALRSDRLKLAATESATADERQRDDGQVGDRVAPPGSSFSASRPVSGHDGPASRADRAPAPVDLLDRLVELGVG
jgi:hypothetical protein